MSSIDSIKQAQQEQHLRALRDASVAEKSKVILNNSGFAAAIHHHRDLVSVKFGK